MREPIGHDYVEMPQYDEIPAIKNGACPLINSCQQDPVEPSDLSLRPERFDPELTAEGLRPGACRKSYQAQNQSRPQNKDISWAALWNRFWFERFLNPIYNRPVNPKRSRSFSFRRPARRIFPKQV